MHLPVATIALGLPGLYRSGFGREFVLAALARGEKVIATARTRSVNKLEDLRAKGAAVLELDAAWPTDKIKEVVEKAESIHGRIDVLFNNAGTRSPPLRYTLCWHTLMCRSPFRLRCG